MKRIARSLIIGAVVVVALGLLAAGTYLPPVAVLLWPGFLLANYVCSYLGFAGIAFENFGWIFWPAVVIDIILYAMAYLLFRQAARWKRKSNDRARSLEVTTQLKS